MNSLGEFRIDECKGIKEKIEYIKISNQRYTEMNYGQLISTLVQMVVDWDRAASLEAARLIKFNGDKTRTTKEYKGYVYVVPERDNLKIDKIIKILNIIFGNTEMVYVKFVGDPKQILADKNFKDNCNTIKREQHYKKKLEEEKLLVADKLFGISKEISDEELAKEIAASDDHLTSIEVRLRHLEWEKRNTWIFEMERVYHHIKWILNDTKQAELFGITVDEYRSKYREGVIMADSLTQTFLGYVKILQSNFDCGYIIEDYIYDTVEEELSFDDK